MRIEKNICVLFLLLGMSAILNSCAHGGPVTSVNPCVEIPFIDAAEAACTNTVTHTAYLVSAEKWSKLKPNMIMIHASDWTKIKLDWLKACRMMISDGKRCNVALESVDKAVLQLDAIVKKIKGEI